MGSSGERRVHGEFESEKCSANKPKENLKRKMALNTNTFSPFSMRSPFNDAFFRNGWEDGWMIPSRSQNTFKEFKSMFNQDETKVEEDETKMEVKINASEYKPEELKVSVQSGQLLVEGKHEEKKEDGSAYVMRSFSRSYTLPKEAQADQMVSKLSSEGVLVITTPKSAPAITNEAPKEK